MAKNFGVKFKYNDVITICPDGEGTFSVKQKPQFVTECSLPIFEPQVGDVITVGDIKQNKTLEYCTVELNPVGRLVVYSFEVGSDNYWKAVPYGISGGQTIIRRNNKPFIMPRVEQ